MSTIFGENIHHTLAPWSYTDGTGVERTKFQGFDVNSWAKDCFSDKFVLSYKDKLGNDKTREVDNKGVIHFTKDGCIILNGTMYTGGQCLNTVYEAYTGNKLATCGDAEKFMLAHADDPHLTVVYFHIYNDSSIVGDSGSVSNSTGTGFFITYGSSQSGRLFYQHYWWNGTHNYRVIANNCSKASGWINPKDIHKIDYDVKNHKVVLRGIDNLSTACSNESAFTGKSVSEVQIPIVDSSTDGILSYIDYNGIKNDILNNKNNISDNTNKITYLNKNIIPDLTDKANKAVDRAIYNFDNIVTNRPTTFKPISELEKYDGADSTINRQLYNLESCELNWYTSEHKFLLNLGAYQWPVTEAIIKNTNPDWEIWNQWYSMYGKPIIYSNVDNYQYNLYRRIFNFDNQSKNWRNAADNIYVICSDSGNTANNPESLAYILLTETGVLAQLDWLTSKANETTVTPAPVTAAPVDLTPYITKSELADLGYIKTSEANNKYELKTAHNTDINNIKSTLNSYITYTKANSYYLPKSEWNSYIINYVSKTDLQRQTYIKESTAKSYFPSYQYLVNQSYITTSSVYSMLEYKASKSSVDQLTNKVDINTSSISDLYSSYNTLYSSFNSLKSSYNSLYNAVAYNISYHNAMINYLINLHIGKNTSTPAPVTSAPVTSAPITYIKLNIKNENNNNVLWDSSYAKEIVEFKLNDSDSTIGSTYCDNYIQLNNVNFNGSSGYTFNLTLVSGLIPTEQLTEDTACQKDHGYKLIWSGDTWTTRGSGPSEYCPSTNIKEIPYILEGSCGSKLTAYTYLGNSYCIWSKYQSGSTTIPGVNGGSYYTAKFRYIYPYLTYLGEYPNVYVINDDSTKHSSLVTTLNKVYNIYSGVTCSLVDSWVQNNRYYVKYSFGIKRAAAEQFNKGTYVLNCGLHTCSPQTFTTDGVTIK